MMATREGRNGDRRMSGLRVRACTCGKEWGPENEEWFKRRCCKIVS